MTTRPTADEPNAYYARYIALVPDGDLLTILAQQADEVAALLAAYSPAQTQYRPAPDEWNAIEIVGHLAYTERVLAYRAVRIARGDATPLEGVNDFAAYVTAANFAGRTVDDVVAEYLAVRQATLALLRSLDMAAWDRRGSADGEPISLRALAYIVAGHDLHHLADLRRYRAATSNDRG
jgi:hypothetical protein